MTAAHLNMSLVFLKEGETVACVEECDKALEIAPDNVKALYRRAQVRYLFLFFNICFYVTIRLMIEGYNGNIFLAVGCLIWESLDTVIFVDTYI